MKRTKKMKKINGNRVVAIVCSILVAFALLISVIAPVLAATQQQVDDAKKKTQDAKDDYEDAVDTHGTILEEYNSLDKQISETEDDIAELEDDIETTKADIALKQKELEDAEAEYELYKSLFLTRARVMYENSDIAYIEILFGAEDFSDLLSKVEMISLLMEYDKGILTKLNDAKEIIADAKEDLETYLSTQETNMTNLEAKKSDLDDALEAKQTLLDEAAGDVEKYKLIYEAAEKAEQDLINSNKNAFDYSSNPVNYNGGRFSWPVPGSQRVTSRYGYRIHPVYKTKKFHTGIDIGAGYGLNIVAAADGVVTLAATNGGYGKCIVINHGSGITTLYGHCSSLLVSKGATVTKGQVIAKVGSTGVSTGPHLHFEVRINGGTTDPMPYITGN